MCQRELKKKRKKKGEVGESFVTRIERIQLEQDTGKTINATRNGITESLVDFNRAGCALIGKQDPKTTVPSAQISFINDSNPHLCHISCL